MKKSPASLKISKTDAARRQLESAIRLWFYDGDPVSVHTLAAAAHQLVHDLGKARGITAVLRELPDIRPEYKKQVHQAIARDENFFKHADRDPDALLEFKPVATEFFIIDAVLTYEALTSERPPVFRTYQMWMTLQNPDLVRDDLKAEWLAQSKVMQPYLARMSKQEFFTTYLDVLSKHQTA